jgi:hypothetical protein
MPYRQHQKGSGALQTLDAAKRLLDDPQLPAVALVDRRPAFVTATSEGFVINGRAIISTFPSIRRSGVSQWSATMKGFAAWPA